MTGIAEERVSPFPSWPARELSSSWEASEEQQLGREYLPERPRPKERTADGGEEAAVLARDEFDM